MDNLPLLRDIHLPPTENFFPLGTAWFVVAIVLLLLISAFFVGRRFYRMTKRYYALKLIRNYSEDTLKDATAISELLRRICLVKNRDAVAFYGQEWIDFLQSRSRQKLSEKTAELLMNAPYLPADTGFTPDNYRQLRSFATDWIGENL